MGIFNFGNKKEDKSKNIAKNRLKLILIQDRALLSPQLFEQMKAELIEVMSKYVDIDQTDLDINIEQFSEDSRKTRLVADIPINPKNKIE